jgi:serine/threonine protein kinase
MGNSASALPYSIDNQVGAPHDHNGWALHNGKSTSGGKPVSVFVGKKPQLAKTAVSPRYPQQFQLVPAHHHYNNCRKLRHPHILKVYATLDTDNPNAATTEGKASTASSASSADAVSSTTTTTGDLIVVTEPCSSLEHWLLSKPTPEQLAWGMECIIQGLHFLHNSAKLAHGNMSPSSFYVTPAGDVKVWNFSLVTPIGPDKAGGGPNDHFQQWENCCTPDAYRSPERVERRWDALSNVGVHCMDSYGLGILMDHWFSGRVPGPLQKAVQRLQTTNLKMRPRLQPLLKCPVFDTPYQKIQLQLQEILESIPLPRRNQMSREIPHRVTPNPPH